MRCALCPCQDVEAQRKAYPGVKVVGWPAWRGWPAWPWCADHDEAFLSSKEHARYLHYSELDRAGPAGSALTDFVSRMRAEALNAPKPK